MSDEPGQSTPEPTPEASEPTPESSTPPSSLLTAPTLKEGDTPPVEPESPSVSDPTALKFDSKPDWLPEQHWNPATGEVRVEAALKSYQDAQKELHRYKNNRGPGVPAEVAGYLESEAIVDGHFTFGEEHVELPPLPGNDPLLGAFAQAAFEQGLSLKQHDAIVRSLYPAMIEVNRPTISIEDELIKLGKGDLPQGEKLRDLTNTWIDNMLSRGQINEEQAKMMTIWGSDANSIWTLLTLREAMGEKRIPLGAPIEMEGVPTEDELLAMTMDPKYATDAAYRKEVEEATLRAHPRDPKNVDGPVFAP